jgi:Druantia protein DruA
MEDLMEPVVFRYRARELTHLDIEHIRRTIVQHSGKGRSHISRVLCQQWNWLQPNGNYKEYAARDLLLRLEEAGHINLPPRLRPKNNLKRKSFAQIPIFDQTPLCGGVGQYDGLEITPVDGADEYLWGYLLHRYHYLGLPKLVGEHLRYLAYLGGQVVACLAWASAAFKVKGRDDVIGWDANTRRSRLHLVANNTRFLVLPWIRVKHLASKILSQNCRRLSDDWRMRYHHRLFLAETFVDTSRFAGTCYKAANWRYVGHTSGSAKRGNSYRRHGQTKAVYLYPLVRHFEKELAGDKG